MPHATIEDLRRAQRVLVYGVTGSGKSTTALLLGARLGLPVRLVDDEIGWLPGWVERDLAEQRERAGRLASEPRWVFDSAYGHWRDVVTPRADLVLALDYPRWLSLARLLRRTARRWVTEERVCNGNVESLRQILSTDSILLWHARSFARKRRTARAWESAADGIPVLRLRHPQELDRLLAEL